MHEHADDAAGDILAQRRSDQAVPTVTGSPPHISRDADDAARIEAALRATHALAFPRSAQQQHPTSLTHNESADECEADVAEDAQLRSALRVLRELALPAIASAYAPLATLWWRRLAEPGEHASQTLELGAVSPFRRGEPIVVSPAQHPGLWRSLTPWRATAPQIEEFVLIPVRTDEEVCAVFALGFAQTLDADRGWLRTAVAVATSCAAGIEMLRLRRRLTTETQARDAYISLAAHELRSPITSIKGYAQLLIRQARKSPLPEPMMRSVESIEQQSVRMAEMVGELLDASRIHKGSIDLLVAPSNLVAIVRRAAERRAPFYPQHDFTVESEETSLAGYWDVTRIEQVVRDLLDNAARHTPAGGRVATTITRQGNLAIVSVRDEGIGVAEGDRERIFDYLYRAPTSVQRNLAGLGLGLYVSRHIIERHGGRLTLSETRTEEPTGSEFRFTLPITATADGINLV